APRRWSGEQAILVAAGAVTVSGFAIDRIAVLNSWLGEPWLAGIIAGASLLMFGVGWRWLDARWAPPAAAVSQTTNRPAPAPPPPSQAPSFPTDRFLKANGESLVRDFIPQAYPTSPVQP